MGQAGYLHVGERGCKAGERAMADIGQKFMAMYLGKENGRAEVQWTQPPKGRAHYGKHTLCKVHPLMPEMSKDGVRKMVEPLILEYFENGD